MRKMVFVLVPAAFLAVLVFSASAWATLKIQKQAKEQGFEAKSCLYCHNEKLPKKDAVTFNERGQWLIDQKKEREVEALDVSWLKDYVEKSKAEKK
jgi:hypothetical protein